jgi:hypothetical protein
MPPHQGARATLIETLSTLQTNLLQEGHQQSDSLLYIGSLWQEGS